MNNNKMFGTVIGLVIILALAWGAFSSMQSHKPNTKGPRQALFLADGQIFFGYASDLKNQVVTLTDVFYLRSQSSLTPADPKATATPATNAVDLIKLGDEIYGPTDEMHFNRDRITHMEDMKADSQINQKIKEFKEKGN